MRQLTVKLIDGEMQVGEFPIPSLKKGCLLIRNHYSVISVGTEISTVKAARKGYIGKAKDRPQQVKQVLENLKRIGITQTYRAINKKLDAYSPLGNSCAGEVIDLSPDVKGYTIGDLVACGGFSASHAEVVSVPVNLCVRLKPDTDLRQAAYNTLGAIAIQGVRQADIQLGETCAVIGLGLIGQLTCLLLGASGVRVIGIDIDPAMIDVARKHCVDLGLNREDFGIEEKILRFTKGLGCDAVIITAASESLDPINFAGAIARKRGTVVVVGAVPTGFDREPHFYKKELQVKMSCSYGPGRYDPQYEEKGIDYPPAYVRWTENRNMQSFQDLVYSRKIDVSYLTTHVIKLDKAPIAYDMMLTKSESLIGILLEYDANKPLKQSKIHLKPKVNGRNQRVMNIGFIGGGSYAQSHLLPNIPKSDKAISLKGIMTIGSTSSKDSAERFNFDFCTANADDILQNNEINTVFIATRHDSHAQYVIKALHAGKHVFVEKPLCITIEQLEEIEKCYRQTPSRNQLLMIGYNRRFSSLTQKIKKQLAHGPMAMIYRVNAGFVPADSWIHDDEIGGGRIIGEVCHFVDYLTYINGSLPVSVYASTMEDPNNLNDVLTVSLSYQNGSIGTISYFANGDNRLSKEHIEIYANGCTAIVNDFKSFTLYAHGKKKQKKMLRQDKGQKHEINMFIDAVLNKKENVISFEEIHSTSLVTFKILESIQSKKCLDLRKVV